MSLTSYRAAPPRAKAITCEWVLFAIRLCRDPIRIIRMGTLHAPASKPGGDLLFHCLSNSTIGAVRFHGRVRDGIGWVTDAMVTKLWDRRFEALEIVHFVLGHHLAEVFNHASRADDDGGTLKREMSN